LFELPPQAKFIRSIKVLVEAYLIYGEGLVPLRGIKNFTSRLPCGTLRERSMLKMPELQGFLHI
jgi:hypothetical protein